jgi:predicted RecB family nuclease
VTDVRAGAVTPAVTGVPADGDRPAPLRLGPVTAGRCRRRIHLDHDPAADRAARKPPDPGAQLRLDDLAEHRRRVREQVAQAMSATPGGPPVTGWAPDSADRPAAIWAPPLTTPTRFGTPELLLRAPDGGYLPVLVRGHRTLDAGSGAVCSELASPLAAAPSPVKKMRAHHADALALAHVHRMLGELGLASRQTRGGIIGHGGPATDPDWDDGAVIVWHELGPTSEGPGVLVDYDDRFADRLAVARAAAAGGPALAQPSRVAECRRCPWWPVCEPELTAAHDVSLLVAGSDVAVLHAAGVRTYDELAAMPPSPAAALPLTGIPPAEARARALAMVAGVPLLRRTEQIAAPRADVELDVDMESYLDDGAYLWGTLLSGDALPGFPPGYRPFVTWQPLQHARTGEVFVEFWRYLCALRAACAAAGLTFAAYCYSRMAEERWLYGIPQRFPGVPGMPARAEIDAFCRSAQWVDLYAEVKKNFVVPGSLRLKLVAAVAGFTWRDPEPSGENSLAWYRLAIGDGAAGADGVREADRTREAEPAAAEADRGREAESAAETDRAAAEGGSPGGSGSPAEDVVAAHRQRLLRYNEDDVLATLALRRWMRERASDVPTVADLEASVAGPLSSRVSGPVRT